MFCDGECGFSFSFFFKHDCRRVPPGRLAFGFGRRSNMFLRARVSTISMNAELEASKS